MTLTGCTTSVAVSVHEASSNREPPVSTFALACTAPSATIMTWLNSNFYVGLTTDEVTTVDIGTGLTGGSDWWLVVVRAHTQPGDGPMRRYFAPWLTDVQSIGGHWIEMPRPDQGQSMWQTTNWTGDRLARGKAAWQTAVTCLS